jgi:glycosyltransferase involved in cell wall biosynthesis
MQVEILYLAFNRLQFTTATWSWLVAQTNWDLAQKIVVYDDGSEDGTQEFLKDAVEKAPVPAELRIGDFRSPPAIMNHYISTSTADAFAKIDNDIAVPGGWLDKLVSVLDGNPELELLGMEAGMVAMQGRDGNTWEHYTYEPATHIGGVGLMRMSAFRSRPTIPFRGRFGFTEWQDRYDVNTAWIKPDIDCPSLDRVPEEPWASLTEEYVERGWSRPWGKYDPTWCKPYYEWLTADEGGTLEIGR